MFEKFWKLLKENFTVIIAICTSIITLTYAVLKFIIYVYWSGYFNELNINNNYMQLDYEGFIFRVIFVIAIVGVLIYLLWILDGICSSIHKILWKKERKITETIRALLGIVLCDILLGGCILIIANFPIIIVISLWRHVELNIFNIILQLITLSVCEIFLIFFQKINYKDTNNNENNIELKLGKILLLGIVFVNFILAGSYYYGATSVKEQDKIQILKNESYMISYRSDDNYVLHKVEFMEDEIIIYRNVQKIINIENCEYVIKYVNNIRISDEIIE